MTRLVSALLLLAALGLTAKAQTPDQTEVILKRLDQLEKQNAELLAEIKALRETLSKPSGDIADRQEISEHRIEELAQTKVGTSQHFPVELTGTVLFNAFLNGAYGGASQDPLFASLTPGPRTSGGTLRQTVLGLKFDGPQTFLGGNLSGSVYMDFFGGTSFSLNHLFRLRVATLQLSWTNTTLAVGQDKPIVSRREPNSLAQVGVSPLTGAGNPWLWQPQARIEQRFKLSNRSEVNAEVGIFQTSEGTVNGVRAEAARPALEARINFKQQLGEERFWEVAPVFHLSTTHYSGYSVPSRLYGVDWLIKPASKFEITGLLFHGKNFSNLGALGGFAISNSGAVIPIRGTGGWLQVRYMPTQRLSFNLYGGQQDDNNNDLSFGSTGKNQYYAGNAMFLLAPNVMSAFEFGQNRTTYLGQGNRLNNHYDLALAYLF